MKDTAGRLTITMSEVSRRYGIARDTVRDAMKSGRLPWKPRGRAKVVSAKRADEIWGVA